MKKSSVRAGIATGLLVCAASHALAAEAVAETEMTLDEITVTAERVEMDLQKTPQFISVKSGEQLKSEGKVRIEDIMKDTVGLTMEINGPGLLQNIFMRGVSNGSAGVAIVVDGAAQTVIPQSQAQTFRFSSLDVSQVAIARGVQNGAGVSALSGTVSVVTNKPVFELQASGSFTTGSFRTQNGEGVLNLPLTSNQAVRLAFSTERRDAFASNGLGEVDNRAFRLGYRWRPSDKLDINASYAEGRSAGANSAGAATLFTGHWQPVVASSILNYTNPYSGVTTTWGQQIPGRSLYYTGDVLAGFTAQNQATNTIGVGTLGISSANTTLATNGQYYYPAPTCIATTAFTATAATTAQSFTSQAAAQAALANLGPASAMWGCPFNEMALRDGIDWDQRRNPWDDGFRPGEFMNTPGTVALNRQINVNIDWALAAGDLHLQPSYLATTANTVIPARGTGWTENTSPPGTGYRLDTAFTSKMLGNFQYIIGFNGSVLPAVADGYSAGANTRVVTAATQPWATANTAPNATNGVTPNAGAVSLANTNCYFVLPSGNAAGVVQATAKGVANNSRCNATNFVAGTSQRNYSFSTDLRYTLRSRLHLNGTVRYDLVKQEQRNQPISTLVDGDGQRYVYVQPQSTLAAATAANPNQFYAVPYRMNISSRDLQALADAYPTFRDSSGGTSYTLNVQYDFTPSIIAYARLATGTTAGTNTDSATRAQTSFNVDLPDARVPAFGGNAAAAAIARSGLPYQVTVTGVAPGSRFLPGEKTRQLTAGFKSRWFDNRLQLNFEAFYNKFNNRSLQNIIGNFPTDVFSAANNPTASQTCSASGSTPTTSTPYVIVLDPAGTVANRGASCFNTFQGGLYTGILLSKGVDVDVSWTPTSSDRIDVTAELLSTQFKGAENLPTLDVATLKPYVLSGSNDALLSYYAGIFNDFPKGVEGYQLANAPKLTINTTYQHRFLLQNGWTISPRVQYNYTSTKYVSAAAAGVPATDANTVINNNWAMDNGRRYPTVVPNTGIWNVFVTLQPSGSRWFVNAYVNNVRDTAVLGSVNALTTYTIGSAQTNDLQQVVVGGNATLGSRRIVGVTISARL